ncbi:heterokaryon incompatibility protein-domain-containing protein [Xylaria acuta]|nr:heterokaryon incompatibility protein-domain-containing protein [Xylaria acuta]
MRLINTQSLELEEFFGSIIPKYAILSHTWGMEEVTFQDWNDRSFAAKKTGYKKILDACRQARRDGLDYLWVDTNFIRIDKKSSAEISEAINSMFAWYSNSERCYVYLADFARRAPYQKETALFAKTAPFFGMEQLHQCKWFTREFRNELSEITGINVKYFFTRRGIFAAAVSEKILWLALRKTTRDEDLAYCMLGIFEINMPLLYGEGRRAFLRLQEEIIRISNDQTIFCWSYLDSDLPDTRGSVLAPHPSAFHAGAQYMPDPFHETDYSLTNNGISVTLPAVKLNQGYSVVLLSVVKGDSVQYHLPTIDGTEGDGSILAYISAENLNAHLKIISAKL